MAGRLPPSPVARLFVALWPDAAARQALADWAGAWAWPGGTRRVPPERWHVTLHFIGPVPETRLPEVMQGLRLPAQPCTLHFGQVQRWPGGLIVLAPLETLALPEALMHLHQDLAEALRRLGLPVEARPWRPHVTLARKAAGAVDLPAPPAIGWPVRGHALVRSQGGYHTLARYD